MKIVRYRRLMDLAHYSLAYQYTQKHIYLLYQYCRGSFSDKKKYKKIHSILSATTEFLNPTPQIKPYYPSFIRHSTQKVKPSLLQKQQPYSASQFWLIYFMQYTDLDTECGRDVIKSIVCSEGVSEKTRDYERGTHKLFSLLSELWVLVWGFYHIFSSFKSIRVLVILDYIPLYSCSASEYRVGKKPKFILKCRIT